MSVSSQMDRQSAAVLMEEAERWLVRLDGQEVTLAEHEAFARWRSHPEHMRAFDDVEQLWHRYGDLRRHPQAERLARQAMERTVPAQRVSRTRRHYAVAASVGMCVLGAAAFLVGQYYTPARTYTTAMGQRSAVQLDDGSLVTLNSATELKVRYRDNKREFLLKQGEAIFQVAEDSLRPFTVSAGDGEVTALGTRFQVRRERQHITVTLLEGRIALDRTEARQHVQLKPGEQVRFVEDDAPLTRRAVDPEVVSSWATGRLKFKSTPLAEVLEEVNRYSRTRVVLGDPSLAFTPINGNFDVGNSASVVAALEALLPVEAAARSHDQIVLSRR